MRVEANNHWWFVFECLRYDCILVYSISKQWGKINRALTFLCMTFLMVGEVPHFSYALHLLKMISCSKVWGTFQAYFHLLFAALCQFYAKNPYGERSWDWKPQPTPRPPARGSCGPLCQGLVLSHLCFSQGFTGLELGGPCCPSCSIWSCHSFCIVSCSPTMYRKYFPELRIKTIFRPK